VLEQIREQVKALLAERQTKRQALTDLTETVKTEGRADFTEDEYASFGELRDRVQAIDAEVDGLQARLTELEALDTRDEEREKLAWQVNGNPTPVGERVGLGARVKSEPTAYRSGGNHSFFMDAINVMKGVATPAAAERLQRHMNEVRGGVHGEEFRDVGTGAFASLVVPQFLPDMYAENLHAGRVTANLAAGHDLPAEGMTLTLPRGNTNAEAAVQATQGTAVQNTDYGAVDLVIPVNTYAGQQNISRQAAERGRGTDEVIFADLAGDYSSKLDQDVISGPGSGGRHSGIATTPGHTVPAKGSGATPITGRQFLTNLADALQRINSNRFLPADGVIMHPRRWGWLTDQADSNGRPLVATVNVGAQNVFGVGEAARYGLVGSLQGVPVWTDANIPTSISTSTYGLEDLVIVTRRSDLHLWEDGVAPRQFRFEETLGGNLQVKLVLAGYSAFTADHHPEGVAVITGSGLITPTF